MHLILKTNPKISEFEDEDQLEVNTKFEAEKDTVNFIPKVTALMKELTRNANLNEQFEKEVNDQRKCIVDALIVRIMKVRKTQHHTELVNEIIEQAQLFTPEPQMIKNQIESLIGREYLERDTDNREVYKYIPS